MQPTSDPRETVYVARQPILDRSGRVYGYELLYRDAAAAQACIAPGDFAGAKVVTDALLTIGLETLTNGRPAFFNLTRALLVGDLGTLLPPAAVILELREDIEVDAETIDACRRLQKMGYTLALDDFVPDSPAEALLSFAKFVKIDVLALSTTAERLAIAKRLVHHASLVAEKVESVEIFEECRNAGYGLFQGYYFCRPVTVSGGSIPTRQMTNLQLVAALNRPNLTIGELDDLVKKDAALCYRVLRCINSAAFGVRREIHSIREALVLLGIGQVRKWASVWALAGLNAGACAEVMPLAIIRARCCEILAERTTGVDSASEAFLLGLCSLLDVMLKQPMTTALGGLPLPAEIRNALLGKQNFPRSVLDAVIAYERGDWTDAFSGVQKSGAAQDVLPVAYADALRYARELTREVLAA
jgi:c-di-GMP-related signal transduction protein